MTWPRQLLRGLLSDIGEFCLAVRLGYPATRTPLPPVPRRGPAEAVTTQE
ncbi:hypothetical protein ACQP2Y_32770 [Actinoplanes sp. CA-051413]